MRSICRGASEHVDITTQYPRLGAAQVLKCEGSCAQVASAEASKAALARGAAGQQQLKPWRKKLASTHCRILEGHSTT